jgi:hypothetical protein
VFHEGDHRATIVIGFHILNGWKFKSVKTRGGLQWHDVHKVSTVSSVRVKIGMDIHKDVMIHNFNFPTPTRSTKRHGTLSSSFGALNKSYLSEELNL